MKNYLKTHVYDIVVISLMTIIGIFSAIHINSHLVLWNALKALIDSLVFYFRSLFSNDQISNAGVSFLVFDESLTKSLLPIDFEVFGHRFIATFELLVNPDNITISWSSFLIFLTKFARILLIVILPLGLLILIYYLVTFKKNSRPGDYKSKTLKLIEKGGAKIFRPSMLFVKELLGKWKKNKWYKWITLALIVYNLNLFSIAILFFAAYFYFIFSFDLLAIYFLAVKILLYLSELIHPVFYPVWAVLAIWLIEYIKVCIGRSVLKAFIEKLINLVRSMGYSIMTLGVAGTGKDLIDLIIVFIQKHIIKSTAIKLLFEIRHEFPEFNWRGIEDIIEKKMADPNVANQFMNKIQVEEHFKKWIEKDHIWEEKKDLLGYSLKKQRIYYWDGHRSESIVEAIYDYAQLYYIYISKTIESNYSIRVDKTLEMNGHFPKYKWEPLKTDPRNVESFHRSIPIDFNEMRLLKPVVDDTNLPSQTIFFDAGVMMVSEYDKERGNRYSNQNREFDTNTSPAQDGTPVFNALIRHLTTVRNHCFGRIVMNGQNLSALAGDEVKKVETVMFISSEKRKTKLAIPLFWFESTILAWAEEFFSKRDKKYAELRNDKSLYSWFIGKCAFAFGWINRIINANFAYEVVPVSMSGASLDGNQMSKGNASFYLIHKIPYSDVYRTDLHKEYWRQVKIMAITGINQRAEFSGPIATAEELRSMHGYLPNQIAFAAESMEYRIQKVKAIISSRASSASAAPKSGK